MDVALERASTTLINVSCSNWLALDGADQVGHQIRSTLILVQHLRPAGLDLLVGALKAVISTARQPKDRGSYDEDEKFAHFCASDVNERCQRYAQQQATFFPRLVCHQDVFEDPEKTAPVAILAWQSSSAKAAIRGPPPGFKSPSIPFVYSAKQSHWLLMAQPRDVADD